MVADITRSFQVSCFESTSLLVSLKAFQTPTYHGFLAHWHDDSIPGFSVYQGIPQVCELND